MEDALAEQLAAAMAQAQINERRKCENVSCANYKEIQIEGEKLLVCGGCKSVGVVTVYCKVECQKIHWKDHKTICSKSISPNATASTEANPPPLAEHVAPGFSANFMDLLAKFAKDSPTKRAKEEDEEDEDEEGDYTDDDEEDEDDEEEEEENQDVDSFGRALPQNRKKRRPAFGGREESDDDEVPEEKVDPFLPFGPMTEGTNYWNFGGEQAASQPQPGPGGLISPSKHAANVKKRERNPAGRRASTPRDEETVKKDEQLAALSFNLTTPTQPPSSVQSSTSTDAPVFTFGGSQSDAVPAFSVGTATPQVPTNLPTTFEFGK